MHIKKLNKTIAALVAVTMLTPVNIMAADNQDSIVYTEQVETVPLEKPETDNGEGGPEVPEEPEIPIEPEVPQEPEIPVEPEVPQEPEAPVEPEVPQEPEIPVEPEVPQEPETPEEPEEEPIGRETPEEYEARTGYQLPEGMCYVLEDGFVILLEDGTPLLEEEMTNEELIEQQVIEEPPAIEEDFRFWTVARVYAFAKEELSIRETQSEDGRAIGTLKKEGICYILETGEEWMYVESGTVRGFVKSEQIFTGQEASNIYEKYESEARKKAKKMRKEYRGIEEIAGLAKELLPREENQAFLYTRSTVHRTVVQKKYALALDAVNIQEEKDQQSRVVGVLEKGGLCYILAEENQEWLYVESGDVRGFVWKELLGFDDEVKKQVEEAGEDTFAIAEEEIAPEENKACYYTITSVKAGIPGSTLRNSVLEFASQFVGNPYVWGGTSLTQGADCSGFVQSIYREFGYSLPRVAAAQAHCGMKIPVEDAQPGDLVFYAKNGEIYHVVIYAGEGRTLEAMGTEHGIVSADLNTGRSVWAVRLLDDTMRPYESEDINQVNVPSEELGTELGEFDITYQCSCPVCSDGLTDIEKAGIALVEGETIAADPELIPTGTKVVIGGHCFTAEDTHKEVKGKQIVIFTNEHGRSAKKETVYLRKE